MASFRDEREVDLFSRRVDNKPQRTLCAGRPGDHKVIDDATSFVEQLGIALATGREIENVGRAERFKKSRDGCVVAALDQRLTHVRNIKQTGGFASMEVLGEDSGRVSNRHVVARERRHARAKLDVQSVERCL